MANEKSGPDTHTPESINRRNFLGRSGLALAASATLLASARDSAGESRTSSESEAAGTSPAVPTSPRTEAEKPVVNNRHVLELQDDGGKVGGAGPVTLDYFGHCAFRVTSPQGLTLLFDPWRNDPSGAWGLWFPKEFPKTVVDVGLSTHRLVSTRSG